MRLSWLSRCNFYFCLCHKLALWPWASHQISLTHANISEKGYCKALISADDYYTHKSSSSFSSLFSSLAISLSFQRWSRKLSGSTQKRYFFRGKKPDSTLLCHQVLPDKSAFQVTVNMWQTLHCSHQRWGAPEPAEDTAYCAHHSAGPHKIRKRMGKKRVLQSFNIHRRLLNTCYCEEGRAQITGTGIGTEERTVVWPILPISPS